MPMGQPDSAIPMLVQVATTTSAAMQRVATAEYMEVFTPQGMAMAALTEAATAITMGTAALMVPPRHMVLTQQQPPRSIAGSTHLTTTAAMGISGKSSDV